MGKRLFLPFLVLMSLAVSISAQMVVEGDTLNGTEWIAFDRAHYRLDISEDGVYEIRFEDLEAAGIPVGEVRGDRWQMFRLGKEVPLWTSTEGLFAPGDHIRFYGQKLRGELDQYLYTDPERDQLNPEYGLITDTCAYYLTWVPESAPAPLRWTVLPVDGQNPPPAESWAWGEAQILFTNQVHKRYYSVGGANIYFSHFDGDGFASPIVQNRSVTLSLPGRHLGGPDPQLVVHSISNASASGHDMQVLVNGEELIRRTFSGVDLFRDTLDLTALGGVDTVQISVNGLSSASDRYALALARVRYPAVLGSAEAWRDRVLRLPSGTGERFLVLDATNGQRWLLLEEGGNILQEATASGGQVRFRLPAGEGERDCRLIRVTDIRPTGALTPVLFSDPANAPVHDYLILSGGDLLQTPELAEYAAYRASAVGGGYTVGVLDVATLYDLYGYGIRRHPLAIKNFSNAITKAERKPRYLFIIGKGREYNAVRTAGQLQTAVDARTFFVPTFGWPGSDHLLFSSGVEGAPHFSVGRLAATNGAEIGIYLQKVQEHELADRGEQTIEDQWWKKRLLHLGGGGSAAERTLIRSNLEQMAVLFEESDFGAHTTSFYKTSSDPVQESVSENIFSYINDGTAVITFFGHGTPNRFDFNVDDMSRYFNKGKYPMMLALGCHSGNIFTPGKSIGERFVLAPDKGALAFGATLGQGYMNALRLMGSSFYQEWGGVSSESGLGDGIRRTMQGLKDDASLSIRSIIQQFIYHGDPAIRLKQHEGPDYHTDNTTLRVDPELINEADKNFRISFTLRNLGRFKQQEIPLRIEWMDASGQRNLLEEILLPAFHSAIQIERNYDVASFMTAGRHRLYVTLNPEGVAEEWPLPAAYQNNELVGPDGLPGWPVQVVDNALRPVWPPDMAVHSGEEVVLSASTTDAMALEQQYVMEIDTIVSFSSPALHRFSHSQRGGLVQWRPELSWEPGRTYYWRVSPDSINPDQGFRWEQVSFTYDPGIYEAWRQQHTGQWLQQGGGDISFDDSLRIFRFPVNITDFQVRNKVFDSSDPPEGFMNSFRWSDFFRWEAHESLNITVFDTLGRLVRNDKPGQYGSLNTTASVSIACFPFPVTSLEQRTNIVHFLDSILPDGYLIMLWTAIRTVNSTLKVEEWANDSLALGGRNIFNLLEAQGAERVRELEKGVRPWIFAYIKGEQNIGEVLADSITGVVNLHIAVPGFWTSGSYSSPPIGPSEEWSDFAWSWSVQNPEDSIHVDIYGIPLDGDPVLLFEDIRSETLSLAAIDAQEYPNLQLRFQAWDPARSSVPDVHFWEVSHRPAPELAVAPGHLFQWNADSLQIGDSLRLAFSLHQLSTTGVDSVRLRFLWTRAGMVPMTDDRTYPGIGPGDSLHVSWVWPTDAFTQGDYRLQVEVLLPDGQREAHAFNNFFVLSARLFDDRISPVLDVLFDGRRIAEGELVSTRPEIALRLRDENPFFPPRDPGLLQIILRFPDGSERQVLPDDPDVTWTPASEEDPSLRLWLRPELQQDGLYRLRVEGRDVRGNAVSELAYQVGFRVEQAPAVRDIRVYPNPLSGPGWFEYTLSGTDPAGLELEIYAADGRLARSLSLATGLEVGQHRFRLAWDGFDASGALLPGGVYYFRVKGMSLEGEELPLFRDGKRIREDQSFGSLILLR